MRRSAILLLTSLLFFSCSSGPDQRRAGELLAALDPARPFPESAFVKSEGLRLHYRAWKPEGEARGRILLLHGFGASTFSFRFLVPDLLEEGWEVAAADIPPFGYSDKSEAIARAEYRRGGLLWAVPEALGWEGEVIILGHSMGALYASAMALERPERVSALVFLAGAVPADGKGGNRAPPIAGLFTGILESSLRRWKTVSNMLEDFAGEKPPEDMVDGYYLPFQQKGGVKALLAWSKWSGRQPLPEPRLITAPVLLLWGEKDDIVPLKNGKELEAAMPHARLLVLPGLGHLAHELQAGQVNPLIVEFLRAYSSSR